MMEVSALSRQSVVNRLIEQSRVHYDITMFRGDQGLLEARCDYHSRVEKYFVSRKINLWAADSEEFLYIFTNDTLTLDQFRTSIDYARDDALSRAKIGSGHMYTYITPIFVCGECTPEVRSAVRKCSFYKSFFFSLHGWAEIHTALLEVGGETQITTNKRGKELSRMLSTAVGRA